MTMPEEFLNLLRLQSAVDADELAVQRVIQYAIEEGMYANPAGAQLPGSAVLKALREMDQHVLRAVLWPGSEP